MNLKTILAAAAIAVSPFAAQAVTITLDDLGVGGEELSDSGAVNASLANVTVGAFDIATASSTITHSGVEATLNTTSLQVSGVGTLQITAEETGLMGGIGDIFAVGSASSTDTAFSVVVEHLIDVGFGYQTVGSLLDISGTPGAKNPPIIDGDSGTFASLGMYDLKTIITVTTTSADQVVNINATLSTSPVPIPAGILLMGTALAGMGVMHRRKKRA